MDEADICPIPELTRHLQSIGIKIGEKGVWRLMSKERWPGCKIGGAWHGSKITWQKRFEAMARSEKGAR